MPNDDLPIVPFPSMTAWEKWLDDNYSSSRGVWLKIAKKASGISSITYQEAVESALCFGWIDGQRQSFDEDWFLQRFTPRRSQSRWSQINRDKVAELKAQGRMRPAGLAEVESAKTDGRWEDAYASPSKVEIPDALRLAFDDNPVAGEAFAALNASSRYSILYRIHHIKDPEARDRRVAQVVEMLTRGEGI